MKRDYLPAAYFVLFAAVFLATALIFPGNNWDAIGYVAAAKSIDIKDKTALHTAVYEELRQYVPQESYRDLTQGSFQETASQDPESLAQVLPFYRIRPAYVLPIYLLSKIGINSFLATHVVTVTAVVLGLWIFYLAVRRRVDPYLLLMLPVFAVALGVFQVARISTPDGLAFMVVALIFYLLLRESWLVLLVLPLSLLIRSDQIIFVLLLLAYLFVTQRRWRWWAVGASILTLLLYFSSNYFAGNYGYATVFWVTFVERVSYPAEITAQLTWPIYTRVLLRALLDILHFYTSFLSYGALVALTALLFLRIRARDRAETERQQELLAISLIAFLSVIIHFLLFPAMWPRFFAGQYFLGAMVLLVVLSAAINLHTLPNNYTKTSPES